MPDQLPALKAAGIETLISNRPDGEAPMQPDAADMAKACAQNDITFHHLPIGAGFTEEVLQQANKLIKGEQGAKTHMFCASGTRCTVLWCFANAKEMGVDEVLDVANQAGYQLAHLRPMLESVTQSE